MKIALDAMGGDFAPFEIVRGAIDAVKAFPNIEVVLVGDEARIYEVLKEFGQGKKIRNSLFTMPVK